MARTIAVTNQKGGVGKTTTTINLGASLAATRRRVLVVDLDPQGNTTTGSGVDKSQLQHSVYDLLMGTFEAARVRISRPDCGYDLIPANDDVTAAEVGLVQEPHKDQRLRAALSPLQAEYDYILIDCPPALSMLTVNALVAAQGVIIPMQCEYYALEGLTALLSTIERIRAQLNPALVIDGLLRTMFDPRSSLTRDVSEQLETHFPDQLFSTPIPRNVRLAEAPSHGLPALQYDRTSRGAVAYLALAGELLRRGDGGPGDATEVGA
ncbi:MAG: ParA family protein [Pseudomonadota bacterium]|nr:ParA family protein [Pseudomonadota bacterium]